MRDDILTSGDTVNMQAGGQSWLNNASDALSYGAGAAVASGMASIVNTGVDVANYFGANAERIDVSKQLSNVDQNWGAYYDEHKDVIDTVGFIGTSFIPGGLAIRGINAVKRGEAFGAFGTAMRYSSTRQTAALESALADVAQGSVFSKMNANFLAATAWGTADQTISLAAFQLASAATMKASPLLDGESWKDIAHDTLINSVAFGAIGGVLGGFELNSIMKGGVNTVGSAGLKYNRLPQAYEKAAISEADKAYSYIDAVTNLPKEVFENDSVLNYTYKLNGASKTTQLDTGGLFSNDLKKTVDSAYLAFERHVTTGLTADPTVGKTLARSMLDLVKEGRSSGLDDNIIKSRLGDYLFNLVKVEGVGMGQADLSVDSIRYLNKQTSFQQAAMAEDASGASSNLLSISGAKGGVRVKLIGDEKDLQLAMVGADEGATTAKDAFANGFDLAYLPNGTWTFNPKSARVKIAPASDTYQIFFNKQLASTSETATLTIADRATLENPLRVSEDGSVISSGELRFKPKQAVVPSAEATTEELTARHLWAGKQDNITGVVSADDFSLLDRMVETKTTVDAKTTIKLSADEAPVGWRDVGNFDQFVFNNKIQAVKSAMELNPGAVDIQALALRINATPTWVQNVVASKFDPTLQRLATGAPDLSTGWTRNLSEYLQRDNVILNYKKPGPGFADNFGKEVGGVISKEGIDDFGNVYDSHAFISGEQQYLQRVKLAKDNADLAVSSVFGNAAARFKDFGDKDVLTSVSPLGTGAGLVTSANAGYGDPLGLLTQHLGKNVNLLTREYSDTVLAKLQPQVTKILASPKDAAELAAVTTKLRRSDVKYTILDAPVGETGMYIVDVKLLKGADNEIISSLRESGLSGANYGDSVFKIDSDLVANFLREHQAITSDTTSKRIVLLNAQGLTTNMDASILRAPPVDTKKVPYFAFVRRIEGALGGDSDVGMILAKTEKELLDKTGQIDSNTFQVLFKKDTDAFFKAKGDYEYSRALNESTINSSMSNKGVLGDYAPSLKAEDILEDYVQFHQRQQAQLVRDGVSTKYAQEITELQRLSDTYTGAAKSKAEPITKLLERTVKDPYGSYIKTMLDISQRSEFTILQQANEFVDALGTRAYDKLGGVFNKAKAGELTWEEANSEMVKYGIQGPYANQKAFELAQTVPDRNLLKLGLQKANSLLTTFGLRLDTAQALVNIISTGVMAPVELQSIKSMMQKDPQLVGKLAELQDLVVPGTSYTIPSNTKLLFNAAKNFFGPDKAALLKRYEEIGTVTKDLSIYHEMVQDLTLLPGVAPSAFNKAADKWIDKAAGAFGTNKAEQFTRFVSADIMRQLSAPLVQAGKLSVQEQNAFISTYVNRVQGNYVASQRPILFQGTIGSAIGLFQTYQFNLLQNLFRHIENKDTKTLALGAALQGGMFGLSGMPMFDAINTHILGSANMNSGHKDVYSFATQAAGKELGDWMMYGTASAMPFFGGQAPSLFSRGDINPRNLTIVPVNPADIPAVSATARFVGNLFDVGQKLANGGAAIPTLMAGLEHNSVSRPLAGLAQILQGASTTGKGGLVSKVDGISSGLDLFSISNAGRLLGARPLDEAVGLNDKFRGEAYKAQDRDKIETIGANFKNQIRGGGYISQEDYVNFAGKYAAAGGRIETFSKTLQKWTKDANTSVLNQLADHMNSPYGQRFNEVMGGRRFHDYNDPELTSKEQ